MKNWYVKVSEENKKIATEWAKSLGKSAPYCPGIMGMYKNCHDQYTFGTTAGQSKDNHYDFGEEITFDQFKQEILGMKTIIGYNLKYSEYKKAALKICDMSNAAYDVWDNNLNSLGYMFGYKSQHHKDLENVGVLDLWFEPVYEKEFKTGDWVTWTGTYPLTAQIIGRSTGNKYWKLNEKSHLHCNEAFIRRATVEEIEAAQTKTFKVGNFEVVVRSGKAFHGLDDITQFVKEIIDSNRKVKDKWKPSYGGYEVEYKDIIFSRTGCQHTESKLSEWLQVYNAL